MTVEFRLRFPLDDVTVIASRYAYADDAAVEIAGRRAQGRGYYLRDEFLLVTGWKTRRTRSRVRMNSTDAIEDSTRLALATSDEKLRIAVLTLLEGVAMPTASVLLHLAHRDRYPILDFRALWSLGVSEVLPVWTFAFWHAYTAECRRLAAAADVSMRVLDRALWQYSKEHQRQVVRGE